ETKIKENDLIYFITATGNIPEVMRQMRRKDKPYKKIIIAGGGNIGMLLAKKLEEQDYQVKIIEIDPNKTVALSEYLNESIVLLGDAADKELLLEENIENTDAFIAVTSADEANILSSMLAKRLGVHKVMTLINRPSYVNLVESDVIDVAISPKQITISTLLARVRSNNVISAHALRNTISEVIEIIAKGDPETSKVIGKPIKDIPLPKTSYIVAIVRDEKIIMEHSDLVIEQDDRVIMMHRLFY
ncbi:MAG TPA: Trk system potassium transporter TrkA, partial [Candidatus Atribacteria bacterium]|nr:Trk system potassium transporter TrkA [Candidatus Atribacteria bacterium]